MQASASGQKAEIAVTHIADALGSLGGRVLSIGDLMIDIFSYGSISRISPEAPIPVLRLSHETRMLGGSGNVARNISSLGGRSILVAPIGKDEMGAEVEELANAEAGMEARLIACENRPTITKRRFVAGSQQILRVDEEEIADLAEAEEQAIIDIVTKALPEVSVIVLSDYGKGALGPRLVRSVISAARAAGVPVLVDPKASDYRRYLGATCITPNVLELVLATGMPASTDEQVIAAARSIIKSAGCEYILVTRSEKGMTLVPREGDAIHIPARKHEVFDVSGAGDTVIATLALAISGGVAWPIAATIANFAAGIVVTKRGTATCSLAELESEIREQQLSLGSKVQPTEQVASLARLWRARGLRVGFTNGCFDLLHPGHVSLLRKARAACDRLIVGLNTDESVKRLKGPTRPLQNETARATVLSALECVDLVVLFGEDTPLELIRAVRPSVLLKGADYTIDTVVGARDVIADGGEVVLVDLVEGQSTTGNIMRMNSDG